MTIEVLENMPKVAILIAVRMKSTRLPRKALTKIEDQTLIEHLIDRVKLVKNANKVILCTSTHPDDEILLKMAEKKGICAFAGEEDDVMNRFIKAIEKFMPDAGIAVRVTGDNPLTSPHFIDNAIIHHQKNDADYTSTQELPQGTKGEIISMQALRKAYKLAEDSNFSEYMTWYFTDNPDQFKIEKVHIEEDLKRPNYRLTVDNPEDLQLIKAIYKKLYVPGKTIFLKNVIKLLDNNPLLLEINAKVKSKNIKDTVNVRLKKG